MKAVKITDLDFLKDYPVDYILKSDAASEMVGCCPKSFFNFFGLLGCIDGLNSDFLFWLKAELREDDETLVTPADGLKEFMNHEIFKSIDCGAGFIREHSAVDFLSSLCDEWVLFTVLFKNGRNQVSHCVVFYIRDGRLFADGEEISLETFAQKLYCDDDNRFLIGRKK